MMASKVKKSYGDHAGHIFSSIIGSGREKRKQIFIDCVDSCDNNKNLNPDKILGYANTYMKYNNNIMTSVKRSPWWWWVGVRSIIGTSTVVLISILMKWYFY